MSSPRDETEDSNFDENYYRKTYGDINDAILANKLKNCLQHYKGSGFREGRYPNSYFENKIQNAELNDINNVVDEDYYLNSYPFIRSFLANIPGHSAKEFYRIYGHKMGHNPSRQCEDSNQILIKEVEKNFDAVWYSNTYGEDILTPFSHYMQYGKKNGYSPNSQFDEKFYSSFYTDLKLGESGFEHYLRVGRSQKRFPVYQFSSCLEHCYPTITKPVAIGQIGWVENRIRVPNFKIESDSQNKSPENNTSPTIWLMMDTLNPDIFFGGYTAFMHFTDAIVDQKHTDQNLNPYHIGFYLISSPAKILNYYMYHHPNSTISKESKNLRIFSMIDYQRDNIPFIFGPNDIFISYSAWLANHAHQFSKALGKRFIFFIQEFESIFHSNDTMGFLVESAYNKPHYAIFNSENLRDYFKQNKLGVFSGKFSPDHDFFNHITTNVNPITSDEYASKKTRRLIFYARPEHHAERNLFAIGIIAIKQAISRGHFKDWEFIGIGALTGPTFVRLSNDAQLKLYPRMDQKTYHDTIRHGDVGLSLIFSPHPGLVHFEMAHSGMIVVVNTTQMRPNSYYNNISPRLVPVEPDIEDITMGLIQAEKLSFDVDLRTMNYIDNNTTASWKDTWKRDKLDSIFKSL